MFKECLEVFKEELERKGEGLILDSYVPADGTYLIIDHSGNCKAQVEIRIDKKTKQVDKSSPFYPQICFYDYHSQLVSMNKPVDSKKIIHSNSYLSFAVKKESVTSGKLTEEIIDGYFETLKDPVEKKYKKSGEACRIYEIFEAEEGKVDIESLERNRLWIKAHIFSLEDIDMGRKDYLKVFFEAEDAVYEREGRRYSQPNIFNSNDYNVEIENIVYGLPDNNLGMNPKKPLLSFKTRKVSASYLLDNNEVILQKKFFDYLLNLVSSGKYHVYIDTEQKKIKGYRNGERPDKMESGYYLRLRKGKSEAEIWAPDNIVGYADKLNRSFQFENILGAEHEKADHYNDAYQVYHYRTDVERLINEVFFSKWLAGNYTIDAGDISVKDETLKQSILFSRDAIFDWVYKGRDAGFSKVLEKVSLTLIKRATLCGYRDRALWQLNLRWSFQKYFSEEGEHDMGEIITDLVESVKKKIYAETTVPLENDMEYYYTVGQLVSYLLSLSKSKENNQSLLNPFLNAKTDEEIKRRILQIYKKYNYRISSNSKRARNLLALVEGYVPGEVNQEMIILGYNSDRLIYMEDKKNE